MNTFKNSGDNGKKNNCHSQKNSGNSGKNMGRMRQEAGNVSYKDFVITSHAMIRAQERLGIYGKKEVQKKAREARLKGVKLNCLHDNNYKQWGLSFEQYKYLVSHWHVKQSKDASSIYYYCGVVWVFCGHKSRTLRTLKGVDC